MDQNQNKNLSMQLEAALSVFNASEVFNLLSRAKDSLNKGIRRLNCRFNNHLPAVNQHLATVISLPVA